MIVCGLHAAPLGVVRAGPRPLLMIVEGIFDLADVVGSRQLPQLAGHPRPGPSPRPLVRHAYEKIDGTSACWLAGVLVAASSRRRGGARAAVTAVESSSALGSRLCLAASRAKVAKSISTGDLSQERPGRRTRNERPDEQARGCQQACRPARAGTPNRILRRASGDCRSPGRAIRKLTPT